MKKMTFNVEGMSCGHCQNAVEKALRSTPGVAEADVDLSQKTVSVTIEPTQVDKNKIILVITEAGYEVTGSHA